MGYRHGRGLFLVTPDAAGLTAERTESTHRQPQLNLTLDGAAAEALGEGGLADLHRRALAGLCALAVGVFSQAVRITAGYISEREQFGKPIATFQAVQFQLADCAVAVAGLRELAAFTLWRLDGDPVAALGDALALRLHAIDVARTVLRATQQLHGAAGVCDEYDISVLARAVQPALRLPWSAERTAAALAATIATDGFVGLFPHGAGHR